MRQKKFQISARSFFAVNTSAAELMYNTISEMVNLNLSCSLIDICCGTGSIGLSLAERCGQVLGIDILEEAINDANKNALANNITNCEFMIGSVEESLQSLWRRVAFTEAICVIDPPRSGVGPKAVQSIRKNTSIAKIIYVASDPQSAMKNFLDFSRSPSNTFKGDPFIPVKAAPVDLFPHTSNFCIIFLFMRVKMADLLSPESIDVDSYLRGLDRRQKSRGNSTTQQMQPLSRNSNLFPEHTGTSDPTPDLTWKKVQTSTAAQNTSTPNTSGNVYVHNTAPVNTYNQYVQQQYNNQQKQQSAPTLATELSKEQIDWLDQMVQLYGSAFERDEWIKSFKAQNAEASANYLASVNQAPAYPATASQAPLNRSKPSATAPGTGVAQGSNAYYPTTTSSQGAYDQNVAVQMYAPGAATGWYAQQPTATNSQGSSGSNSQAAAANWAEYSQQYAQYTQWWNQQQSQQQTQGQPAKPQSS